MVKARPDFIVIGAMKSATSSLHTQLARQPGIFMSDLKEPCYFSDDDQYRRGHAWYVGLFRNAEPGNICGESSTHYTKLPTFPDTVTRMREYVPEVKLIYVIRHPIDRLLSHYVHEMTVQHRITLAPIEEAIALHPEMIAYGRYSMQLSPYLRTFGPDRVLLVFFEMLVSRPQKEFERICHFIGYAGAPTWSPELPPQNVSSERLRLGPWLNPIIEQPTLRAVRRILIPKSFREWVKSKYFRIESKPDLPPPLRNRLAAIFDEDLETLSSWVGFPITCETWNAVATTRIPLFQDVKIS
jgi:hypothetical protein